MAILHLRDSISGERLKVWLPAADSPTRTDPAGPVRTITGTPHERSAKSQEAITPCAPRAPGQLSDGTAQLPGSHGADDVPYALQQRGVVSVATALSRVSSRPAASVLHNTSYGGARTVRPVAWLGDGRSSLRLTVRAGTNPLPEPVVRLVLAFLPASDVANCACACRDWAAASRVPRVWEAAVERDPALRTYARTKEAAVAVCKAAGPSVWGQYARRTTRRAYAAPATDTPGRVLWCAYSMCMARAVALTERIRNQPRMRFTLLPGCTPEALTRAESALGVHLPMQLRCLWLVFNGQHPAHNQLGNGLLGAKGRLGSVEECVLHVRALQEQVGMAPPAAGMPDQWPRLSEHEAAASIAGAGTGEAVAAVTAASAPSSVAAATALAVGAGSGLRRRPAPGTGQHATAATVPHREGRRLVPVGPAQGFSRLMVDVDSGEALLVTSLRVVLVAVDVCALIESAAGAMLT